MILFAFIKTRDIKTSGVRASIAADKEEVLETFLVSTTFHRSLFRAQNLFSFSKAMVAETIGATKLL